jgi:hypothetical protein
MPKDLPFSLVAGFASKTVFPKGLLNQPILLNHSPSIRIVISDRSRQGYPDSSSFIESNYEANARFPVWDAAAGRRLP